VEHSGIKWLRESLIIKYELKYIINSLLCTIPYYNIKEIIVV